MNLPIDLNTVLSLCAVAAFGYTAKTFHRTVLIVERLDERTTQQGERIENLERKDCLHT